jgi:hypothetical protein
MSRHPFLGEADVHLGAFYRSTDPSLDATLVVSAGKLWVDTSIGPPHPLKVRNAGNTAWDRIGTVEAGGGLASLTNPMTTGGDLIVGSPPGTRTNEALLSKGASATATSTDAASDANNALDHDDATAWVAGTPNSHQTYTIDLGEARVITAFRLLQNGPNAGFRANNYTIQSSVDGTSGWTTRKTMTGQATSPDSGQVALDANANARYWRIDANPTGLDKWTIHTLELFTESEGVPQRLAGSPVVGYVLKWGADGMPYWAAEAGGSGGAGGAGGGEALPAYLNLASTVLGATASASTTSGIAWSAAAYGLDDNDQSWWESATITDPTTEWLNVDLGSAQAVTHFRLYSQFPSDYGLSGCKIQSSTNNAAWTDRHTLGVFTDTGILPLASGSVTARYWRVIGLAGAVGAGGKWRISSFGLFVAQAEQAYDNQALTALGAVPSADGGTNPSGPFDGDDTIGSFWQSGAGVANHWVAIDLGSAKQIDAFRVIESWWLDYGATSSKIQSSTNNSTWTDRVTLGVHGDTGVWALPGGPITARYWRLYGLAGPVGMGNAWRVHAFKLLTARAAAGGADLSAFSWKQAVRAASTANVALATAVEAGDTLDGVTLATGDRILLKDQASAAENGIYVVAASGAPTRAADFDAASEIAGAIVAVREGTANANTAWQLTTDGTIVIGTTVLAFAAFGSGGGGGSLTITEIDGAPSGTPTTLQFPNGTLTDQGGGVYRYTPAGGGGTDVAQYMGIQMEAPPSTGWSWVNQGTASTSRVGNAELITAPSAGAVNACRLRTRAVPTAPYVLSGLISPTAKKAGAVAWGLFVRESSSGKFMAVRMAYNANGLLQVVKFTNPSTVSSAPVNEAVGTWPEGTLWYRIEDDGTNLKFSVSTDGRGWRLLYTEARTTFLTGGADEAGFLVDPDNGDVVASLLAWSTQSPLPAVG